MCNQITAFLEHNDLLSQFQSGFRKNHSCKTSILHISNQVGKSIDKNQVAFLILIDFSKAFDTIVHDQLLRKLKLRFGFEDGALELMLSYLSDRKSIIFSNNCRSDEIHNNRGVPQGSILGPILFSIYAEDMEHIFQQVSPNFYADDTQLFVACEYQSVSETITHINDDLQRLLLWSNGNGLRINSMKSKCMIVSRFPLDISAFPPITINNEVIIFEQKVTNLGIVMNSCLKWNDHLAKITKTIYFAIRCLWNSARLFPLKTRHGLVQSLIVPHFIYADVILGELDGKSFSLLERAFNSMVRFVYNLRKYDHISHVSKNLLGLPLREYLQYRRLLFLHGTIQLKKPRYLYEELKFFKSTRLGTCLILPTFEYKQYENSFFVHDAKQWNYLPPNLRNCTSVKDFKSRLFVHFS